jgi:hypothetical protein
MTLEARKGGLTMEKSVIHVSRGKPPSTNLPKRTLAVLLGILLAAATLVLFGGPAAAQGVYPWRQVNEDGFGIATPNQNPDVLDMVVHGGHLYAGVGNTTSGGTVWRYDTNTTWTRVSEYGFGIAVPANNRGAHTLAEFNGDMYCATWNTVDGVQVWRYDTGTTWTQVNADGFGIAVPANNQRCDDMAVFDDHLYAATANGFDGCQVWRYDGGVAWTQVNTNRFGKAAPENPDVWSLAVHDGALYAGTYNNTVGCQVWRYDGGVAWTQVNTDGFGIAVPTSNLAIHNMVDWKGDLYATARNNGGCQVWRYDGGVAWTQVNTDGFGIATPANSTDIWSMVEFGGKLYAAAVNGVDGCQLYRYEEGTTWTQVNEDGFGITHPDHNYAVHCMVDYHDKLFAGALNDTDGCQVWSGKPPGAWTWYLAEGSTGTNDFGSFETWVLVQNPGDVEAKVKLFYQTPEGEEPGQEITLAPHTRETRNVADVVPNTFSVSTRVESDQPVIAERAMYWSTLAGVNRQAATDSIGFDP